MKKLKNEDIINTYIKSGLITYETTLNGNYKKGNKEYPKLMKILKYLAENIEVAIEIMPILFKHENIKVKSTTSAHCLILGIYVKEAEEMLEKIANDEKNGIFCLNAEMTLKVWREGKLKL